MTYNANWFTLIIFVNKKNKPALQKNDGPVSISWL